MTKLGIAFRVANSARGSILLASMALAIALATLLVPAAQAQNTITIFFPGTNYVLSSFGRQLSFSIAPSFGLGNSLSGATLVVTLPPGVSFVTTSNAIPPNTATVSSLTGSSVTGETVTLAIGEPFAGGLVTSGFGFHNLLTVSIGNTVADGTMLQATFRLSGTLTTTGAKADSGPVPVGFQAGYLPVSVSVSNYFAACDGEVQNADFISSSFKSTSSNGTPVSGSLKSDLTVGGAVGGLAATANWVSDQLSTVLSAPNAPVKIGDITGPNSVVRLTGIGGRAFASGGFALFPDFPTGFTASSLRSDVTCVSAGVRVDTSFSNPNPYPVPLIFDQRTNVFLAAGNGQAGFRGDARAINLNAGVADIGGNGVATSRIFERLLLTPGGNTREVASSISCFPGFESVCAFTPPSDTTQALSGTGGFVVAPGVSNGPFSFLEFSGSQIDAKGSSTIATDATTGSVTLIRTGYGSGSAAVSLRFLRGDANLPALQAGEPAKLRFTGGSPIELMVSDAQGRRVGFQPAPSPPPQFRNAQAQPSVLTEIFGASYSGIDSHPQVIVIPDPKPGSYNLKVTGTGAGNFLLTTETLDINDRVIDSQSVSGNAAPGSSNPFSFDIAADGKVSIPGAPSTDKIPPTTTATLSPQPNAAGWNNHDVTVTLNATDNPGGSGVKQITFSASGAQGITSTVVNAVSASIVISTEGVTTLTFFATDNAGNVESAKSITIMLDKTPPVIIPSRTPPPNANGWNNTSVTVSFACTDSLSGLAAGSPPAPTTLTAEGANQSVSGTCKDIAGNTANATVSGISIDKTPPAVSCSANPSMLWPPNHMLVNVNTSVQVTDSLSGPAGFVLRSVTSNEPDSGSGDIQGWAIGTASTSGQLRAERLGQGNGRVYTLTYNGMDRAGNSAACSTTVTVPHDQRRP